MYSTVHIMITASCSPDTTCERGCVIFKETPFYETINVHTVQKHRLEFQRIIAQQTQVHLRLSRGSVLGSYCSKIEHELFSLFLLCDVLIYYPRPPSPSPSPYSPIPTYKEQCFYSNVTKFWV